MSDQQQKRDTLKGYFAAGARPTADNFAQLIDSCLNLTDDGFARDPLYGVQIKLAAGQSNLMSFYSTGQFTDQPDWSVASDAAGTLNFLPYGGLGTGSQLTLTKDGNIGVLQEKPTFPLDVNGTVRMDGRTGTSGTVDADGELHAITPELTGCHAFEVVAGVGLEGEKKGRYALLHAIALNTFNPTGLFRNFLGRKTRIKATHAWYLSRSDRLKLQWETIDDEKHLYQLSLKSMSFYGDSIPIKYSITKLWFDPMSADPAPAPKKGAP